MYRSFTAILSFDIRSISRDHFLLLVILMIATLFGVFSMVGHYRAAFGAIGVQEWIPYVLILSIIANPASIGMVFGVFLIEEVETKVRAALMTTPFSPVLLILMRTPLLVIMLTFLGFGAGTIMSTAWGLSYLSTSQWFLIALAGALVGVPVMISISTIASNRIEAMAMGKFYSAFVIPPILLYLLPSDTWYRALFLVFPTTPIVHAYEAFRQGSDASAYAWLIFGLAYAGILTSVSVRRYLRQSYRVSG